MFSHLRNFFIYRILFIQIHIPDDSNYLFLVHDGIYLTSDAVFI